MANVTVDFKDAAANRFFARILKQSESISKKHKIYVNAIVAKHVIADVEDHFQKGQGPNGPWQPWSTSYVDVISGKIHFRRKGGKTIVFAGPDPKGLPHKGDTSGNILIDSATMKNSFNSKNWRILSDSIEFFNPAKTESNFPYAAAHNEGGQRLPRRRFMWLSSKAMKNIGRDTLQFLIKK